MPPLSLMIKPASGACNLRCAYCFYCDEMENRMTSSYGLLSRETMEGLIKRAFAHAEGSCTFGFQGGEPTLWGLENFRAFVKCVETYNTRGLKVDYFLQTNGYTLDEGWASFFREEGFLLGVSLDGTIHTHDRYRKNAAGEGSFARVMEGIDALRKWDVPFNILMVVTRDVAVAVDRVYRFLRKQGFEHLQFIPCLDPLEGGAGQGYSLRAEDYGNFLCRLFDLWYEDIRKGSPVRIRQFDNYVDILCGYEPEACDMRGQCGVNYVVEADGGVYPCDFFVLDEWRLGSFREQSVEEIDAARERSGFLKGTPLPGKCRDCGYFYLCRGGCRRHRTGEDGLNCFCEAYEKFFAYSGGRLRELARARA